MPKWGRKYIHVIFFPLWDEQKENTLGENIDIESRVAGSIWDIKFDRSQLEQIVLNLAINARDAMDDGGKLTIETTNISFKGNSNQENYAFTCGDYVMLAITDDGAGMSSEIQQNNRMFLRNAG